MAVITLETLVLHGGSVVRDVVTGRAARGSQAAKRQAPTLPFLMRHPSYCYLLAEQERVDAHDDATAADRAGRPGSGTGTPSRRSPAQPAGCAGRGPRSGAGWRLDHFTVGRSTAANLAASTNRPHGLGGGRRLCLREQRLADRTLRASTRGTTGG